MRCIIVVTSEKARCNAVTTEKGRYSIVVTAREVEHGIIVSASAKEMMLLRCHLQVPSC